jgi:tetratricopeptide (TPR) repeat protein
MIIGRFDAAEREFQDAARLAPESAEVRYNLGKLHSIEDNWADARRELEHALQLDAEYMEAHDALGFALESLGDDGAAVTSYLKAIQLNETRKAGFIMPYVNLSALYNRQGDTAKAMEFAQKALDINPRSDQALFQLGRAYERQNQLEQAVASISKAVSLNARSSSYFYVLGTLYRRLGKLDESRRAFEEFKNLDRQSAELERTRREALRSQEQAVSAR